MEQIDPGGGVGCRAGTGRTRGGPATSRSSLFTRRGREHADEPDHQPPLGAVGVRDRVIGRADRRRHASTASRPLYHPSGLMMSIGGAIAGGVAAGDGAAVRRPDVLGGGPPLRGHGRVVHLDAARTTSSRPRRSRASAITRSGCSSDRECPRGLWRRVEQRFRPARVLEFYASTEVGAILVNVRDAKPGSMGRPLPGSAEVRIAAYDFDAPGPRARRGTGSRTVRRRRGRDAARAREPETTR